MDGRGASHRLGDRGEAVACSQQHPRARRADPERGSLQWTQEEKYGRMLADCYREGEPSMRTELIARGLAVAYRG